MLFPFSCFRSRNLHWRSRLCYCSSRKLDGKKTKKKRSRRALVLVFLLFTVTIFLNHTYFFLIQWYRIHLAATSAFEKTLERPSKSTLLHINGTINHLGAAQQIYIINLTYRTDRRTGSIALFQTLDLDAFLVPAYKIHSPEVASRIHLVQNGHITLAELACWASHMQVWLEIAASGKNDSWALVFEDDVDLEMAIFDILESFPRDLWKIPDLIYLGHCGDLPEQVIYEGAQGYRIYQAVYPSCTHAYAIRSHAASKLIHLLASPHRAIDDEIVLLVDARKILAYSVHPPLALQQSVTSLHPSDVNPIRRTIIFQIKNWFKFICEWWRGTKFIKKLKDSTLARADFRKAEDWRRKHENEIWRSEEMNFSSFPYT